MSTVDKNTVLTALAGMAAGALAFSYLSKKDQLQPATVETTITPPGSPSRGGRDDGAASPMFAGEGASRENRSRIHGTGGKKYKPVVICTSPALEPLAKLLRKRVGDKEYTEEQGKTVYVDRFKSADINAKFNWERVIGRKVVMLMDTVDQSLLRAARPATGSSGLCSAGFR